MKEYDAIVIGSGAGGGAAAYGLATRGMKVLLLEQGPRFDPARDYPYGKPLWEDAGHFEAANPDTWTSTPYRLQEPAYKFISRRNGMPMGRPEGRFLYERGTGLGGSTLRFQAEAHRFPEHAFRMRSAFAIGDDWPITYADLEPYYRQAEILLAVSGNHDNPFKPEREPFPLPAHPLGCAGQRAARGAQALGLRLTENSLAIPSRAYNGRPGCIYCRACVYGCPIGDKGSTDVAFIPAAMATGNLELRTGATALKIELDRRGLASGVLWRSPDGTVRSNARYVVVSCGAIETPRLLLNSVSPSFPDGLLNSEGQVGANLMGSLVVAIIGLFDRPLKTYQGVPIGSRVWDFSSPEMISKNGGGYVLGVMGAMDGLLSPSSFAATMAPGWGMAHKEYMKSFYGAHASIFGVADHMPHKDNRVGLDESRDVHGNHRARVSLRFNDYDLGLMKKMLDSCAELAGASGLSPEVQLTSIDTIGASHVGGTARMGRSRRDSVVDRFCRSHEVRNIYVADASALVTQGCGDSPSLTIMALALRASEHLAEEAIR